MRRYRPSRAEINAAHKALAILYAPLTKIETENENESMPKDTTKTTTETEVATDNRLMPVSPSSVGRIGDESEVKSLAMAGLTEDQVADAIEAARELKMAFTDFIPVAALAEKNLDLFVKDVVTIVITNKKPKAGEGPTKPVHAITFETADGLEFTSMFGVNPHRDQIANAFGRLATKGFKVSVGPIRIVTRDVGQMQPAWIFEKQRGFRQDITPV